MFSRIPKNIFQMKKILLSKYRYTNISYSSLSTLNLFTPEHDEMRKTVNKIIDKDINPFVDQWEKDETFPAKEVFKKFGNAGLLGITRPTTYGGLGLDYSYSVAFFEELSNINCGGVPMGIAVHTDMSTPALARFGSEELKEEFLKPSISGDVVSCIGVSEVGCGSDVATCEVGTGERRADSNHSSCQNKGNMSVVIKITACWIGCSKCIEEN